MFRIYFNAFSSLFSFLKKGLLVLIIFFGIFTLFSHFTSGQEKIDLNSIATYNKKVIQSSITEFEKDTSNEGKTSLALYKMSMCSLVGESCTKETKFEESFFGGMASLVAQPYVNPPASGIAWLQDNLHNSGFVPSTYAAEGLGFASIRGYMSFWKIMRNLAYLLLVLVMVAIGFLIMFRVKLGDQAAITLQSALPRIVIALLMISFSFAIVGFLIDIMYVTINLGISILFNTGINVAPFNDPANAAAYQTTYTNANFGNLWPGEGDLSWNLGVGYAMYGVIPEFIKIALAGVLLYPLATYYSTMQTKVLEGITTGLSQVGIGGGFLGFNGEFNIGNVPQLLLLIVRIFFMTFLIIALPGMIINAVIVLTILLYMFKIFFMLLMSYLKILIYTMFAPIILMFEAIPGNNAFDWWFRNVLGELASFPVVIFLQIFGAAIVAYNRDIALEETFALPFLYNIQPADLSMLVGLGLVLLTPDFIKKVKEVIGVKDSGINFGIGTFFAGGTAVASGVTGGVGSLTQWRHMLIGHDPTKASKGLLGDTKLGSSIGDTLKGFGIGR